MEAVRGLREGWVHWFVGAPIVHPETGAPFAFDEAAGRIVAQAPVDTETETDCDRCSTSADADVS